jgi:hypothetical protein
MVEEQFYKPKSHKFDSDLDYFIFPINLILPAAVWPWVYSASTNFWRLKCDLRPLSRKCCNLDVSQQYGP